MAITIDEARNNIGNGVIYAPRGIGVGVGSAEEGTITSVNDRWVFVRYAGNRIGVATDPADLTLLAGKVPEDG